MARIKPRKRADGGVTYQVCWVLGDGRASTPGAPLLDWTFFHASKTRRLSISNDFTSSLGLARGSSPAGLATD